VADRTMPSLGDAALDADFSALLGELQQGRDTPLGEIVDRLRALGSSATTALIAMATSPELLELEDDSAEAWAPVLSVRLLGMIVAAEAVRPLVGLLDRFEDDALGDTVVEALGEIGPKAVEPLRQVVFDRRKNLFTRSRAGSALAAVAKNHPEARAEVVGILRERLDPAESREPDDEVLNGFAIGGLMDLKAVEAAPDIRRAFDEDRVDGSVVELRDALRKLGLPDAPELARPSEGFQLRLVCTACHYERPHLVDQVYLDPGVLERRERGEDEPYSEYIVPQPITCPKCGALDQYELSNITRVMLSLDLIVATKKQARGARGKRRDERESGEIELPGGDRVKVLRFGLEDGRPMHPLAGRDMYRGQVEAEPERADLRLRYGKVLRFLGHYDEALEQCRAAASLDPTDLETLLTLGMLARDAGKLDEARAWLEATARQAAQGGAPHGERADYLRMAVEELADLGRPAQPGGPAVERALDGSQPVVKPPKVGRNDPCYCGSGKKYKKCHGR